MSRLGLTATVVAILIAVASAAVAATDVEQQRSTLLECKKARGIGGAAYLEQNRSASTVGGKMTVQIVPYANVMYADAEAINQCAARRLGLLPSTDGYDGQRKRTIVRSQRFPAGRRGMSCGRNPSILYKGDLYCQWARR